MRIEAIGVVAILIGLVGWMAGPAFSTRAFFVSTLFSSAAAILLTSLGQANVQPAHLLLGFLAVGAVARREPLRMAGRTLAYPREGFWLALTAIYAVLSAAFLPRIFAGTTDVFAIARTQLGTGVMAVPLHPTTGNVTQPIYFAGDVVCFCLFYAEACKPVGLATVTKAALLCATVNLVFAAIDVASYLGGLGDMLAVIRNGDYRMLNEATVGGFKRIVGSFPEASTFAYYTIGFFAFSTRLWLAGVYLRATVPLTLLSFAALVFSTSSTGYAGTTAFLGALFLVGFAQMLTRPVTRTMLGFVGLVPAILAVGLLGLRLYPPAWNVLVEMVNQTVFDKLASSSGVERSLWNTQALTNFVDTHALGGGVGSVRASSFPVAVLGNVGVIGALTYGLFLLRLFLVRGDRWAAPFPAACQSAARWACFAQLAGASVAGSFIDLGLPFFIFAGLACARPMPLPVARSAPRQRPLSPAAA